MVQMLPPSLEINTCVIVAKMVINQIRSFDPCLHKIYKGEQVDQDPEELTPDGNNEPQGQFPVKP